MGFVGIAGTITYLVSAAAVYGGLATSPESWTNQVYRFFTTIQPAALDYGTWLILSGGLLFGSALLQGKSSGVVFRAYEQVINNMMEGLIVLDPQGKIVQLNPAAELILGLRLAQVVGESLAEYFPEWSNLTRNAPFLTETQVEVELGEKKGRKPVTLRSWPVRGSEGEVLGSVVVLRDTACWSQAERDLRRWTEQMETLGNVGLELSTELDLDELLYYIVSQAMELMDAGGGGIALYQQDDNEVEWVACLGPYAVPQGYRQRRGEGLSGRVWEANQPLIFDDYDTWPERLPMSGEDTPKAVVGVPVCWGEEFLGVLCVAKGEGRFSGIDANLLSLFATYAAIAIHNARLVHSLRESEKRFRELADTLPQIVFETNNRGQLTFVNQRAIEIMGGSMEAFEKGVNALYALVPDQRKIARQHMKSVFLETEQDSDASAEYTLQRADGSTFPALIQARPIVQDDKVIGLRGIIFDITDRKAAEEQVQASLREKELLLKDIHHRVKNNLQIVSSLLFLQSECIVDEQAQRLLKESQERVQSLALIHEQLYTSPDLAQVDFYEYITNLAAQLFKAHRVSTNVVGLKVKVPDISLGLDTAIPCSLIVNELVTNALKYAFPPEMKRPDGSGKPEVCISLGPISDQECELTVSDNGVGLPPDVDYREADTLGLQIVKLLTLQIKGKLTMDREGGSRFRITFPCPSSGQEPGPPE